MKEIVKASQLVPFLNTKNNSDLKFRNEAVIERKEVLVNKVESLNEEEGTVWCTITTQGVDRMGDIVASEGIDTNEFKKIPSVFINHDYSLLPVAKCLELKHMPDCIMAKMQFVLSVPVIKNIFELVKAGVMKGISIGFDAKEVILKGSKAWDGICKSLKLNDTDKEKAIRIISKWELYEFSLVSIPANSDCYTKSLKDAKQEVSPELIKYLGIKELKNEPEVKQEIKSEVKEEVKEVTKENVAEVVKDILKEVVGEEVKQEIKSETKEEVKEEVKEAKEEVKQVIKEVVAPEPVIEIIPHVKRYIQVIQTPEETNEYIQKSIEARLRGKTRIVIVGQ